MSSKPEDRHSDQHLLAALRSGDETAFDLLYDAHWQSVYSAALKRLQNPDQAKDVTQEVFLQLWLKRSENHIENLGAYLHTAAKNKIFTWLERERKFEPIANILLLLESAADASGADTELLRKEFMSAYEALIGTLTQSQQRIFRMRYQKDLSTTEIAEQLGLSRKTVQNQLGIAVTQLKTYLTIFTVLLTILRK